MMPLLVLFLAWPSLVSLSASLRSGTKLETRGPWGVHRTGTLRVEFDENGCRATYRAEGSYFCDTEHVLTCGAGPDESVAAITHASCTLHCSRRGSDTRTPCDAETAFSGAVWPVRGDGGVSYEFRPDAAYIERSKYAGPRAFALTQRSR